MTIDRRDDVVRLWSRQGKDLTAAFPDLASASEAQVPDGFLVDGEAVVWTDGRLDFDALQRRLASRGASLRTLVRDRPAAFDVLAVAGHNATRLQWTDRRALLEELAGTWGGGGHR